MPILHAKLLAAVAAAILVPAGAALDVSRPDGSEAAATVTVAPHPYPYRLAGDFQRDGEPVDAPLLRQDPGAPLVIMRSQVSAAEYDRCVADGACKPRDAHAPGGDVPAVGMSWEDATAYAGWLSARTGEIWRLPSDAEWARAAGTRFADDAIGTAASFSDRWLAKYEQDSARARSVDRQPRPIGSFGENENGLLDVSGNVWEWTDTCFIRRSLDAGDRPVGEAVINCGVRVVEGQHRTYVTDFIRDARAGGCSVGVPPANLGFRLVREARPGPLPRLLAWLGVGV